MFRYVVVCLCWHLAFAQTGNPAIFYNNFPSTSNRYTDDLSQQQVDSRYTNPEHWGNVFDNNFILPDATYFIVASKLIRPSQVYKVASTVYHSKHPITLRSSIQRNDVEIASDFKDIKDGVPEVLLMRIPASSVGGDYKLRVEGLYNGIVGGVAFSNETKLIFSQQSMTILMQTDKPIYKQSEIVRFRAIPITTELRAFDGIIDVFMIDPKGNIMRRWLSRQSNLGTVSLNYQLSDQPIFGEWTIKVVAQGQVENATFIVEEYYQTRFEVNVTMSPFVFISDTYLTGTVMANYTGGAPVNGNLTLRAEIRPHRRHGLYSAADLVPVAERYFTFDESYPFWYPPRDTYETRNQVPHMKWFRGVYHFKYPMVELRHTVPSLEGMEVVVTATVGERFLDEIVEGYSASKFYNSSVRTFFLGGSPQVFKPSMPYTAYLAVTYHDGSALPMERLLSGRSTMALYTQVKMRGGQSYDIELIPTRGYGISNDGVWQVKIDLRSQLGEISSNQRAYDGQPKPASESFLKNVDHVRVTAAFSDITGERNTAELLLISHHSPSDHHIKVSSSTQDPIVGEYIVFHVQSNFPMEQFDYVLLSKGIILVASQETMTSSIHTFAVPLSAEMAPSSTIVVYHVGKFGDVIVDSMTFPVNGMTRNNFTVIINNRKARTGEKVEVAIYGEPGSYVGLSAIDRPFFTMQAGNELTYASVIAKMDRFEDIFQNSTITHTWLSHGGDPDEIVSHASSTFGVDANRTFEYAGLVVFTDIVVPRKHSFCNHSLGQFECLSSGRCFTYTQKCDGFRHCDDGTDETNCPMYNATDLNAFRKSRFNRIQRHYDNVWMWKDINIGPHGRHIFELEVPKRPAHWMITAFGTSPTMGFSMMTKPLSYMAILPFFITVEMPNNVREGEQVGIRVTVFNYMQTNIEATVILDDSRDYKFVHVEKDGVVASYNPRTSNGEHQFFVYIKAQDATFVMMPIVATRLGDVSVTIRAKTLIASDSITRTIHVEANGIPQLRHTSTLLDLSSRSWLPQYLHINITETPVIPYDIYRYYVYGSNRATISIVGDVVGPIYPTMPINATSLLNLPLDGAEQTAFGLAVMYYTNLYMRLINQRNRTLEREAFHYMNIEYQRLMSFQNEDGSFSLFRSDWGVAPKSVWLTSFCVRTLREASFNEWENYLYIDPKTVSKGVAWMLRHQTEEGSFYDVTWIPDRNANVTHRSESDHRQRNITLTAHALITLSTVKDAITGDLAGQIATSELKAKRWLAQNFHAIDRHGDPYEIAIVAYALMISKADTAETGFQLLFSHARLDNLMYWGREPVPQAPTKQENTIPYRMPRLPYKYDSSNIEATAYALLVYVARQQPKTEYIVKWLNEQRLHHGGWASTQDTVMAMKALIEYTNRNRIRDISDLTVSVEATSTIGLPRTMHIGANNIAQLQKVDILQAWGTVKVSTKGAGYAILQMSSQFNVDTHLFQTDPPVYSFALVPKADFDGRNKSHITYRSCQKWTYLSESPRSGMAVLDIAIPSGYMVQQQKLDAYVRAQNVRNLQRAKYLEQRVLFYFDYLDDSDICVKFTIERWMPVANMSQYLPIRVYDYYAPERFNETIFDASSLYYLTICDVCGSSQCPYCPIYNSGNDVISTFALIVASLIGLIVCHRNIG